ncbi:MAG: formylglycine-generating enzyme family protein [Candidatus Aegiribacteria sp.]|nr:formylglycine-generating enzyme family protein [Candidatus Aegiribacteria sp.]
MKYIFAFLPLTLLLACGDGEEQVFRPDPLPLMAKDTAFVYVTGGVFITEDCDTVEISDFRLGRYEVSNRLYYYLADDQGLELPPDPEFPGMNRYLFEYPDHPVVNVSVREAAAAAAVLGGRLPTRSEWAYAASLDVSGNFAGQYPWGSLEPEDAEYPANFLAGDEWDTRGLDGYRWTAPVDSFPLTDAGFACQAGNVAEWTYSPLDSVLPVCGGAWLSPGEEITIGAVRYLAPGDRARHIGFRILLPGT